MTKAHIVIGLGYGDEGKGSWVDHLVRKYDTRYVVRFNGGAQAMHHVVMPDGRLHRFAQFGSGSLRNDTFTCLSRFMLIEPEALLEEAAQLASKGVRSPLRKQIISENAPIITPFNRLLNQIQEIGRGGSRHGSCGFGIGLTQGDVETLGDKALYVRDLKTQDLRQKLAWLAAQKIELAREALTEEAQQLFERLIHVDLDYYINMFQRFAESVRAVSESKFLSIIRENDTVFEGAQGVLLDQQYGFFPHCTRSNCTFQNAETLLHEAGFDGQVIKIGLLRGYGTRHGAGPFMTEDTSLRLPACHNETNTWQGSFRLGWFDAVTARYALDVVGGVDTLAITNLDRMRELKQIKVCTNYHGLNTCYQNGSRLKVLEPKLDLLAERTKALWRVKGQYLTLPGFAQYRSEKEGMESYLNSLTRLIGNPIQAYSSSAVHHKHYRKILSLKG